MGTTIALTSNDPALLSYLVGSSKKSTWVVKEVEEIHYLISPHFQGFTTAEEIRQAADDLLFVLNGIMRLKFKNARLEKGSTVAYFDEDGQLLSTTVSRGIACRVCISAGELYFQNEDAKNISSMDIWMKAQNDVAVEEALQHYSNEHNWFNLYKVYEIIEKDTCRSEEKRTIARGTFDNWTKGRKLDFKESANKGRHSSLGYHPRKGLTITYMSLREADEYVTDLFFLWLQSK
jgi:hypothetical protein